VADRSIGALDFPSWSSAIVATEVLLLVLVALLIAANAVFVAAEFSFVTVDRATVDRAAKAGDRRARGLEKGLRNLSTQMSGAQFGITITSLVVGFIAEPSIASLLLRITGSAPTGLALVIALTSALIIATGTQAILGELVPKNWAISQPFRVGRAVAGLQRGFTWLARPAIHVLHSAANAIVRLFGIEPREELTSARAPSELVSLVTRSGVHGTLDDTTASLLSRSILFGDRRAENVMTPRPQVDFVSGETSCAQILDLVASTGHARFPVVERSEDDVVGIIHFRDALKVSPGNRESTPARRVMQPFCAVPESLELDPLLTELRAAPLQFAVVVDEYGGTAGIVTLEDLVEEIVGEIQDEQDRPERRVRRLSDGTWELSGLLRPDEASEVLGVALPEGEQSETLGGLIIEKLGRIPREGDTVIVRAPVVGPQEPVDLDVALTVHTMDERRIDQIRVRFVEVGAA
jgi:CBS domain containing-hemolysin-like protein